MFLNNSDNYSVLKLQHFSTFLMQNWYHSVSHTQTTICTICVPQCVTHSSTFINILQYLSTFINKIEIVKILQINTNIRASHSHYCTTTKNPVPFFQKKTVPAPKTPLFPSETPTLFSVYYSDKNIRKILQTNHIFIEKHLLNCLTICSLYHNKKQTTTFLP